MFPGIHPPADLAPLKLGKFDGNSGITINGTNSYRYLGLRLTPALSMSQMAEKALAKMRGAWNLLLHQAETSATLRRCRCRTR